MNEFKLPPEFPLERKNLDDELARIDKEGYDKTKFCSAECALIYCCDHCFYYDFKPGDCGCYLNAGQCDLHGRRDPEDSCADFVCRSLRKISDHSSYNLKRVFEKRDLQRRKGVNICLECWGNIFCNSAKD